MRCNWLLVVAVSVAIGAGAARAELLPNGVLNDEQTSIVYYPETGELAVDAPADTQLTSVNIDAASFYFDGPDSDYRRCLEVGEVLLPFGCMPDRYIWKAPFGRSFGSFSFGKVAPSGLLSDVALGSLSVVGSLAGGGDLGRVDLVYMHELYPGDANRDFSFDQLDLVQVQQAAKYRTGEPATWGEGDWDGAPGGSPGNPPLGDGVFDQKDIVAALASGNYLSGPYAAISPGGVEGDEQTSIIYDANTGELGIDVPASTVLTSINIDSAAGVFTGDKTICNRFNTLDGCRDDNIFHAFFGQTINSESLGNVAQTGLSEEFVANDLTVVGSLAGGGDLGDVDLIYIPESSTLLLALLGIVGLLHWRR